MGTRSIVGEMDGREEVRKRCSLDEGRRVGTLRPEARNDPVEF